MPVCKWCGYWIPNEKSQCSRCGARITENGQHISSSADVFNTFTAEQKRITYRLVSKAVEETKTGKTVSVSMQEQQNIASVLRTMTDRQRAVLTEMVNEAILNCSMATNSVKSSVSHTSEAPHQQHQGRTTMSHCMNCGQQLVNGAKFCFACGTPAGETACSNKRQQEWVGKLTPCPSCGENIPSFTAFCPACGYELRGADVANSVRQLADKIEAIEKNRKRQRGSLLKSFYFGHFGRIATAEDEQKISLISNFPIPNTKEDLYEFLILSKSNIDIDAYDDGGNEFKKNSAEVKVSNAWKAKFEQAYQKSKIVFANDPQLHEIESMYETTQKSINKAKWKTWKLMGLGLGVLMIMFVFLTGMLNADDRRNDKKIIAENARLEAIVAEVYDALEDENYTLARAKAASLTFSGPNTPEADNASEKWDKTRTELLAIIDAATEDDSDKTHEMNDPSNSSAAENNSASSNNTDIPNDFTMGYDKADFDKYNSPASENGLGDSRIYFYCTLNETEILEADGTTSILGYVTDSSNNDWLIQLHFVPAVSKTAFDSYVGEELVLRGVYSGFSGTKEMPVVVLDEMIVLSTGENVMGMQKLLDE